MKNTDNTYGVDFPGLSDTPASEYPECPREKVQPPGVDKRKPGYCVSYWCCTALLPCIERTTDPPRMPPR